jgi:hypothetical protein
MIGTSFTRAQLADHTLNRPFLLKVNFFWPGMMPARRLRSPRGEAIAIDALKMRDESSMLVVNGPGTISSPERLIY